MNPSDLLWLVLLTCPFVLTRADVETSCTSKVLVNADPLIAKGGTIKKGIEVPGLASNFTLSKAGDCEEQKKACLDEMGAARVVITNPTIPTSKTTWKNFICKVVGKDYSVHMQVDIEYHCNDEARGQEITTTKIDRNVAGTPFTC